jgi:NDP-sugar pyrophosphorylase family protein
VDRPFLRHQLDMLSKAGVREAVFSVAYQPEKVRAVFGDGDARLRIRYAVEETPLGTGGAVMNAEPHLDDVTVVLNGDVLTSVDLGAVVAEHQERQAAATLVLHPVENPAAYGLVEFDGSRRVKRFVEKPDPEQITTDTINAGIYVLQTSTLELMPEGEPHSIERGFFPSLLARGDLVAAWVHAGYWIDIGTPERYLQVHRDVLRGRFPVDLDGEPRQGGWCHPLARIDPAAQLEGPFYAGSEARLEAGAQLGPETVLGAGVHLAAGCRVSGSVLWPGVQVEEDAVIEGALLGPGVRVGRRARVGPGAVLGEGSVLSPFSHCG